MIMSHLLITPRGVTPYQTATEAMNDPAFFADTSVVMRLAYDGQWWTAAEHWREDDVR